MIYSKHWGFQNYPCFTIKTSTLFFCWWWRFCSVLLLLNSWGKNNTILPKIEVSKYKNSNLTPTLITTYKSDLIRSMEQDKLFLNPKLSIHDVSEKLSIPRQYISEVLNEHMDISFQDFLNQYRVEEFIKRLKNDQNDHFTLLAIATEFGFNS